MKRRDRETRVSQRDAHRPPSSFISTWNQWYPEAPPVGFLLRVAYKTRWLRIHSLPKSKRLPTSDRDRREILRRHNTVVTELFGLGAPCLVTLYARCRRDARTWLRHAAGLSVMPNRIGRLPASLWDPEHGVFTGPLCLFGHSLKWRPGVLDRFILAVAQDKVRGVVVSIERGVVYAPYDGGADLIYRSPADRRVAHSRYSAWLSAYPGGL
jgi:hypothetical protein